MFALVTAGVHRTPALKWVRFPPAKKEEMPKGISSFLEQGTGIEPASEAWEATIIADIRTLHGVGIIADRG